jgi:hypothetical protein
MRKALITILLGLSLLVSSLGFGWTASAAPPLPDGCTKERGTIICVESEPVGNSGKTKDETVTKKGSFQSSHDPDCSYENPADQTPPGKQGC